MKEAMRCHPGVSFPLERVVPEDGTNVCGVHLEPGTIVGINPAVIHRDVGIFGEDAADFNPERWLGSDQEYIKRMDRHLMTVYTFSPCSPFRSRRQLILFSHSLDTAQEHVSAKIYRSWKWESLFHRSCAISTSSGLLISLHGMWRHIGSPNNTV